MATANSHNRQLLEEALKPLARRLLGAGVTSAEFESAVGRAFVAAAMDVAKLKNGKVNQSKVAIMTGYSRTEIRKILHGKREIALERAFGARRLLHGWSRDPEFSSRTGSRRPLLLSGPYGSFHSLCKKYSGDIPSKAALDELLRIGAVEKKRGRIYESKILPATSAVPSGSDLRSLCERLQALFVEPTAGTGTGYGSLASDELEFEFKNEFIAGIAEDRARQSLRAFMNGLSASLEPLCKQAKRLESGRSTGLRIHAAIERKAHLPKSRSKNGS